MSAMIMDGKLLASQLQEEQAAMAEELKMAGIVPSLVVIMVGDDPASAVYVRNKARACERVGIESRTITMPADTTQEALDSVIDELNADDSVHGILVQLPLPRHLDEAEALMRIVPGKDVDGFHVLNAGKLLQGAPCTLPCTPRGIIRMLKEADVQLDGAHAVVIGRSNIVGKPVAMLLMQENCTVTICHSHTKNLKEITRQADVLVAAIGKANFVTADMVKPGAAVVDVGINRVDGKLTGDVDFESVSQVAGCISPVPGGVGPMTVSMLMQNTLEAACRA